jgi:hypothetical protein
MTQFQKGLFVVRALALPSFELVSNCGFRALRFLSSTRREVRRFVPLLLLSERFLL